MNGYGKRILVVDEDVGRRARLEVQLEQEGYAVQSACDSVAGAEEMRKRHFDAVIADSHIPYRGDSPVVGCVRLERLFGIISRPKRRSA